MCVRARLHRCHGTEALFQGTKQLGIDKDMVLVSSGANVNLAVATGGERYGHFRSGSRTGCPVCGNARVPTSPLAVEQWPLAAHGDEIERALDQTRTLAAQIVAHIKELRGAAASIRPAAALAQIPGVPQPENPCAGSPVCGRRFVGQSEMAAKHARSVIDQAIPARRPPCSVARG